MMSDPVRLLFATIVVLAAAAIKGTIGFGFPLVAVPLLSMILGPRVAVPLIAIPTLLSNVIMISRGGSRERLVSMLPLVGGVMTGTVAGAFVIRALDPRALSVLVGSVTLLYVLASVFQLTVRVPPDIALRVAPAVGVAAGLIGGSTGVFAPPLASYLHLLRMGKRDFVFWITLLFFVGNVVQVASYFHLGLYRGSVLSAALMACVPMVAGTWVGLACQEKLPASVFGHIILGIVGVASVTLLVQGLVR